jgi:Na+/melibiose symporter-like transporter
MKTKHNEKSSTLLQSQHTFIVLFCNFVCVFSFFFSSSTETHSSNSKTKKKNKDKNHEKEKVSEWSYKHFFCYSLSALGILNFQNIVNFIFIHLWLVVGDGFVLD